MSAVLNEIVKSWWQRRRYRKFLRAWAKEFHRSFHQYDDSNFFFAGPPPFEVWSTQWGEDCPYGVRPSSIGMRGNRR